MQTKKPVEMPLIGLAGRARVGKDTAAAVIMNGFNYRKESFAAPIREFICRILDWTPTELEARKEEHIDWLGTTPRRMMQTVGTEWGRIGVNDAIWVNRCMRAVERNKREGSPTVIPDVRFDNEAEAIRAAGGVIVHVVRPDALLTSAHASENGVTVARADFTLLNDSDQLTFERRVDDLVYELWSDRYHA